MEVLNFMASRLTPISSGVAHSSSHRTRLKVPRHHDIAGDSSVLKDAIERVPGVKDVRIVPPIGSVIVEHEDRPDVLENIGQAIGEAAPGVLALLTAEVAPTGLAVTSLFSNLFADDSKNGASGGEDSPTIDVSGVKRAIPFAFLAAGLMQVLEGEALLAGVGPLALFYWAFDSHWKFKQERKADVTIELEKEQNKATK
jgi:hypothetical protein